MVFFALRVALFMIYRVHVRHARAEPVVAACGTLAREFPRGRQSEDQDTRQSDGLAGGEGRGAAAGAARRDACGRRRPLGDRAVAAARSCRRGARHAAADRSRPAVAAAAGSAGLAGAGADRGPRGRAGGEAGHRPPAERGDGFALAGRGAGAGRGGRGRAVPCPRSVGCGAAGDREGAGEAASQGRHAGALRCHLELPRRPVLRARPLRLQPRRPARSAADRLRGAVRRRRLPGGGRGVRRRHRRSEDAGGTDCQAEGALQTEASGAGRRPRHDHQCQDRRGAEARRARLDHRAAGARHSGARRRGRAVAAVAVRREGHGRDQLARFPGRTAGRLPQPHLAAERARKREDLLAASEKNLAKIQAATTRARNPLRGETEIALKVGAVLGRRKVAKHFRLTITEETLGFPRDAAAIAREAALDGFYVLRTSVSPETLDAAATVLAYKSLAQVERAFRSLKSIDLDIRPVHHRLAGRVRAHVFLCMLAYYVAWHMRRKLAPLLFEDHDRKAAAAARPSPVAAAEVSPAAHAKARTRKTDDGAPVHSFRTLLPDLATLTRNTVRFGDKLPITVLSRPTPPQQRAFDHLGVAIAP